MENPQEGNNLEQVENKKPEGIDPVVIEKLSQFFSSAAIETYPKSDRVYVRLTLDASSFDLVNTLLGTIGIFPWDNADKHVLTIDNSYEIETLVECGLISFENLDDKETEMIEEVYKINEAPFTSDKKNLPSQYPLQHLRSIPAVFASNAGEVSSFDDMSEGEEDSYYSGDIGYLDRKSRDSYQWKAGVLFKKVKGELIEISKEERYEMLTQAQNGNEAARNDFLKMNIRLAYLATFNISSKFPWVNVNDLLQEAVICMNRCIDLYEFGKAEFSTYAVTSMQFSLISSVAKESNLIRLPANVHEELNKVGRHKENHKEGNFSVEELSESLGVSEQRAYKLLKIYEQYRLAEIIDVDEIEIVDETGEQDPDTLFEKSEFKEKMEVILDSLTPRERKIIELRIGAHGGEDYTLEEIAQMFDVTRERIRQIEMKAIRKLKQPGRGLSSITKDNSPYFELEVDLEKASKRTDLNNMSLDDLRKEISIFKEIIDKNSLIQLRMKERAQEEVGVAHLERITHQIALAAEAYLNHADALALAVYDSLVLLDSTVWTKEKAEFENLKSDFESVKKIIKGGDVSQFRFMELLTITKWLEGVVKVHLTYIDNYKKIPDAHFQVEQRKSRYLEAFKSLQDNYSQMLEIAEKAKKFNVVKDIHTKMEILAAEAI